MSLIEPNVHPILVHFTIGLLTTAALLLSISAFSSNQKPWRASMQSAGDWMLALGVAAAIATLIAGFIAYYTVVHDTPSHAAMTVHRNWAIATLTVFLGVGLWRFKRKATAPSAFFALVLLFATCLLTTTAWWGGTLVYKHGIGVQSLPVTSVEGHDHEHGPVNEFHHPDANSEHQIEEGPLNQKVLPAEPVTDREQQPTIQDQEHSDGHDHDH